jgi:cytochrome c oxidase assembly protein subunit 15
VHVEATRLARIRAYEVSPTLLRRLSWAALASLFLIVASGAIVRLTASGLGCDNWPRCGDTPFPEKDFHAIVEFGNRVVGLVPITLTFVTWLAARRTPNLPRAVVWLALGIFLGTIAQGPLGGLTVLLDLHPLLVMSHFLLAMLVLGGAAVLAVEAWGFEQGQAEAVVPSWLRRLAVVLAASALAVVVTGAFVTAAGPHSGGDAIERLGSPMTAVWVHVRATAVFGIAFLVTLAYLGAHRRRAPVLFGAALAVLALVLVQVAVGEIQYRTELPWWLVLVHVALAAAIWAGAVALAALFYRPPAPVARATRAARAVDPAHPIPLGLAREMRGPARQPGDRARA